MDRRVLDEMMPFFLSRYGNASSLHSFGTRQKNVLQNCREQIASLIGAKYNEICFTSGGTEANNLAIKGIALANRGKGNHIMVSSIEHDCIINCCKWLENQGFYVTYLPVQGDGIIDPECVKRYLCSKTILVSVMHANNEIGTLQPIDEIGKICAEAGVAFHTDACQSFGKITIDVQKTNISSISLNAHKIYGPLGVGCLYIKDGTQISPQLHGGGQEHGLRSTTENIAGIVGFAKAASLCIGEMVHEYERLKGLRNFIAQKLSEEIDGFYINGNEGHRLPGNLNFGISGLEGETIRLLLLLDQAGIALSAGSACSNNDSTKHASHVLQAIGRDQFQARGAIRVSLGRFNTYDEVLFFICQIKDAVKKLNSIFT